MSTEPKPPNPTRPTPSANGASANGHNSNGHGPAAETPERPLDREAGIEQIAGLVVDDSQPSIVVLGGRQAVGRRLFVGAVAEKLASWDQPTRVLSIDLEGFEDDRLGDFLAVQVAKRLPGGVEEERIDRVEALLEVVRQNLVPIYNPVTLAMILSMALDLEDPVAGLKAALELPPITDPDLPFLDPALLDYCLRQWSHDERLIVQVTDAEIQPVLLCGTGAGPLTWLTLATERQPRVTLVIFCDLQTPFSVLVPYSRDGVQALGWAPTPVPSPTLVARVDALRETLAVEDLDAEVADGLFDFLVDAALCGPLVPVVPLLDQRGLDTEAREDFEDALEELLVVETDDPDRAGANGSPPVKPLIDLEYTHPGFPTEGPGAVAPTYVYRFADPELRRALLESEPAEALSERARRLDATLATSLPPTTRTIARLRAHVACEIDPREGRRAHRELAWWVRPSEYPLLRETLVQSLEAGIAPVAEIIALVAQSTHRPVDWRLTVLEACSANGGQYLEALSVAERRDFDALRRSLREARADDDLPVA